MLKFYYTILITEKANDEIIPIVIFQNRADNFTCIF